MSLNNLLKTFPKQIFLIVIRNPMASKQTPSFCLFHIKNVTANKSLLFPVHLNFNLICPYKHKTTGHVPRLIIVKLLNPSFLQTFSMQFELPFVSIKKMQLGLCVLMSPRRKFTFSLFPKPLQFQERIFRGMRGV